MGPDFLKAGETTERAFKTCEQFGHPRVSSRGYGVTMSDWDDVRRIAMALPGTEERTSRDGSPAWRVRDKLFA